LDYQLKNLEKRYQEIEVGQNILKNPSDLISSGEHPLLLDMSCRREAVMARAEKAHQELRDYFAKVDSAKAGSKKENRSKESESHLSSSNNSTTDD
jgi:hypothetical protein